MGKTNRALTEAQKKDNLKSLLVKICVVLVAVLVLGLTAYTRLGDSGFILRHSTAAESENFEVNGTMMTYYFNTNYQSYSSIISYLGVDSSTSLKSQACSYIENGTWFDYFVTVTKDYVTELLAVCEAANAAGFTVDQIDTTDIDTTIEQLTAAAETYGYTLDQYLTASMGTGMNEKDLRDALELTSLATQYTTKFREGLSYTSEELETYYSENTASFDGVDYLVFSTAAADYMETDASGNPVGETTEASASAKAEADKLAAAASPDEFLSIARDYLTQTGADEEAIETTLASTEQTHVLASNLGDVSDWALSASAGDTNVVGVEGDTTFTVYYLTKEAYRDEAQNRNVRHILFSVDLYEDSTTAEEVFAEWEAAGYSDEKFAELVTAYSYDEGSLGTAGVYENVAHGEMENVFNAWLFDEDRKEGDKDIIETDYGWHIIEYLGLGEGTAWEANAESALQSEDYTAMVTDYSTSISFNDNVINDIYA